MIQNFQDEVCFVLDTMKGISLAPTTDDLICFHKESLWTSPSEVYF